MKQPKPEADAVKLSMWAMVRKRIDPTQGGQVAGFVSRPGGITYIVAFSGFEEELHFEQLEEGEAATREES